ncbi:MAG TPA: LytR C-terminal domain-containing protein, partial [Solirubrobacteraceae bacterium]
PAAQPLRAPPASATAAPRRAAAPARRGAGGSAAGRSGPPRNALIAGGVVAGLIVIVLLVTQVFGGGGGKKQVNRAGPASAAQTSASIKSTPSAAPVNRAGATIAVLNGTTVPGLAAQVADQLEKSGFKRGQVTNAADQQRSTTTIAYAPGFGAAAKEVVSVLKLRKADPIDANTQAIAGPDASIVVTVGTDRTQ